MATTREGDLLQRIDQLNAIGVALSAERDTQRLLETILIGAKTITNADGGSVYSFEPGGSHLRLEIMRTESLDFALGGTTGREVPFDPIPLYGDDAAHHERMDGSGHPRGLTREQMSIPARIIAVADVFEALTSPSRPYKSAMSLSQALEILGRMKRDNHIDPDIFDVFVRDGVYAEYARSYLDPAQIDVDHGEPPPHM